MNSGTLPGPVNTTTAIAATTTTSQSVATAIATTICPVMAMVTTTAIAISTTTDRARALAACDLCNRLKKKCDKNDDEPCIECKKRSTHCTFNRPKNERKSGSPRRSRKSLTKTRKSKYNQNTQQKHIPYTVLR
ncbi:7434_t:CDS:1, partial [Dentiscutata heterogama]